MRRFLLATRDIKRWPAALLTIAPLPLSVVARASPTLISMQIIFGFHRLDPFELMIQAVNRRALNHRRGLREVTGDSGRIKMNC